MKEEDTTRLQSNDRIAVHFRQADRLQGTNKKARVSEITGIPGSALSEEQEGRQPPNRYLQKTAFRTQ